MQPTARPSTARSVTNPPAPPALILAVVALVVSALAFTPVATAQTADLLISEYVEGSSLNKALELYNGTTATIDLAAGDCRDRHLTCDLTAEYVHINADYRT